MSADSFHSQVDNNMSKMHTGVGDWKDFMSCVPKSGIAVEMNREDFYDIPKGSSKRKKQPKVSNLSWLKFKWHNLEMIQLVIGIIREVTETTILNYIIFCNKKSVGKCQMTPNLKGFQLNSFEV